LIQVKASLVAPNEIYGRHPDGSRTCPATGLIAQL